MALRIPLPPSPGEAFGQAINEGNTMLNQVLARRFAREQAQRQAQQFQQQQALRQMAEQRQQAAAGRAAQLFPYRLQALRDANDPNVMINYIKQLRAGLGGLGDQQQQPTMQLPKIPVLGGQGEQVQRPEDMQFATDVPPGGGIDPLTENIMYGELKRKFKLDLRPKLSRSGKTPEQIEREMDLHEKDINARIKHNEWLEKNSSTDEKIRLATEREKLQADLAQLKEQKKTDLAYQKTLNTQQAKQFNDMEKQSVGAYEERDVLNELSQLMNSDSFAKIRRHPYAGRYELEYYKKSNDKDLAATAAKFDLLTKKLVAGTAKGLNTRFTNMDLQFAKDMKIGEGDSVAAQIAKLEGLTYLYNLGDMRLNKALELAKGNKMSPSEALKAADKAIDADEIRQQIRKQVWGNESSKQMVTIRNKNTGVTETVPIEEARRRGVNI